MQPCLPRFAQLFILACIIFTAQCVDTPPLSPRDQLPAGHDFILTGTRFEERRAGHTVWRGAGVQARGDVGHMAITDLRLTRVPQTEGEGRWTLFSPDADMDFQTGTGRFTSVRLVDTGGHVITASSGLYNEAASGIDLTAPLQLTSPGLQARATAAHVNLRTGAVDVEGPVEGTFSHVPVEL